MAPNAHPPIRPPSPAARSRAGAGLAGLSRAGALIEALAQPLYIWLFGLAGYGIYVVLWGAVSLAHQLRRSVDDQRAAAHRAGPRRGARRMARSSSPCSSRSCRPRSIALLVTLNAEPVAGLLLGRAGRCRDAAARDRAVRLGAAVVDLHRDRDLGAPARGAPSAPKSACASSGSRSPESSSRSASSLLGFDEHRADGGASLLARAHRLALRAAARPLLRSEAAAPRADVRAARARPARHGPRLAALQPLAPAADRRAAAGCST